MNNLLSETKVNPDVILNSLQTPIIVINSRKKTIAYCNSAFEEFIELSREKILGKKLNDFFFHDSWFINLVNKSIDNNKNIFHNNLEIINTKKKSIQVSLSIFKIEETENFFSIILNNLSETNNLKKQFNFEKAAQSASSLVAMLSHEIKNPLSGIKGASQLIKKRKVLQEKDFFLINLIDTETNRIMELLNTLEEFTDERPITKKYVNINQTLRYVKNTSEATFNKKRILFVENYDPSLPKVFGNKAQLIQLFLNIIKNSCEEVDSDNGVIKITTKYEHSNLPLTIYIEDNGNGIPEHLKDNLFDTFVTNKINGRGLGLSISAKIVQSHFGSIIFDSYKGKTVFKVAFKHKG